MNKKITFLPIISRDVITKRMYEDLRPVNDLVEVLKKHNRPYNIPSLFQVVEDGSDKELNDVMAEVEGYIRATRMPVYLQDDARERARNSADLTLIEDLRKVLPRWDAQLEPEDLAADEYGSLYLTPAYREKLIKSHQRTLPENIVAVLPEVEKFLNLYRTLEKEIDVRKFIEKFFRFPTEKTQEDFYSYLYDSQKMK